jgi:hypothetical protein
MVSASEQVYRAPRGASTAIKEAKVATVDLAEDLCADLRPVAGKAIAQARCPLPDHDDRTPSFYVYEEGWHCFGCNRGGDVIDLARLAWGYREQAMPFAAEELLREYGHDVPKAGKPSPLRREVEDARLLSLQRRIYCVLLQEVIEMAEFEDRDAEQRALWVDAGRIAHVIRGGRSRL